MDDYISKPVRVSELGAALKRFSRNGAGAHDSSWKPV